MEDVAKEFPPLSHSHYKWDDYSLPFPMGMHMAMVICKIGARGSIIRPAKKH